MYLIRTTNTKNVVLTTLLPFILFSTLSALAAKSIFGHLFSSGLASAISAQCPSTSDLYGSSTPNHFPPELPYRLPYTGYDQLDETLCGFVTFFHFALQPNEKEPLPRLFSAYMIGESLPALTFWVLETVRCRLLLGAKGGRGNKVVGALVGSFALWGGVFQMFSAGVTVPIFCMVFILSGMATPTASPRTKKNEKEKVAKEASGQRSVLTQQHVEAVLFGILAGAIIPSFAMLMLLDPYVTAIWQLFPFFVSAAKHLHLAVRRPKAGQDGKQLILLMYVLTGIVASSTHISSSWPALGSVLLSRGGDKEALEYLGALWFPAKLYGSSWPSPQGQAMEFLHWDGLYSCVSVILTTFWFAKGWKKVVRLAIWYGIVVPLLGPGTAMAGVFVWREM